MLKCFRKYFVKSSEPQKRTLSQICSTKDGQVAIILIFVTAIALIFYAVILNISGTAQTRIIVQKATLVMAGTLVSQMASYAESIRQTFLGGRRKKCGWVSGWWYKWPWALTQAAMDLFLKILEEAGKYLPYVLGAITPNTAIARFLTGGLTGLANAIGTAMGVVEQIQSALSANMGTILFSGGLYAIGQEIDTTINKIWNREQRKILSPQDQFIENGIRMGLVNAVTDHANIIDYTDLDMDGSFYNRTTGEANDYITRFQLLYDLRVGRMEPLSVKGIEDFKEGLERFLLVEGAGDWGLWDEVDCEDPNDQDHPCCGPIDGRPAYCNPCCMPCDKGACFTPEFLCPRTHNFKAMCTAKSPYGAHNPFIYRAYFDDSRNDSTGWLSFREKLGRDDENIIYRYVDDATLTETQAYNPRPGVSFFKLFRIEDATGIFPFLHKMRDWGIDLRAAQERTTPPPFRDKLECHWTDPLKGGVNCATEDLPNNTVYNLGQLNLPLDPNGSFPCQYPLNPTQSCDFQLDHRTPFVDGKNALSGGPPLKVDQVKLDGIAPSPGILTPDNQCSNLTDHLWKKGSDLYCSIDEDPTLTNPYPGQIGTSGWPYVAECPKHGTKTCYDEPSASPGERIEIDCTCEESTAKALWADDYAETLIHGLADFISWGQGILSTDTQVLINTFEQWYPTAAEWIERAGQPYMSNATDGQLWVWLWEMENWQARINTWLEKDYEASTWEDAWCYPPLTGTSAPPYGMPPGEAAAITNALGSGSTGSLDAVVACLNWNVNDPIDSSSIAPVLSKLQSNDPTDPFNPKGNATKFEGCLLMCEHDPLGAQQICQSLPRSLVPGFDYNGFVTADPAALADFQRCKDHDRSSNPVLSCALNYTDCSVLPTKYPAYGLPVFTAPTDLPRIQTLERCGKDTCLNASGGCTSCYGTAATCGNLVDCRDPLFEKSYIQAYTCNEGGYGSCCEWNNSDLRFYDWEPGNAYYDAVYAVRNSPAGCLSWGENQGNAFYDNLQQGLGTCAYKSAFPSSSYTALLNQALAVPGVAGTPFGNLVQACRDTCVFWTIPGVTTRACELCPSTCEALVDITDPSTGDFYPLRSAFNRGPMNPDIDADFNMMVSMYNCLTGCGPANCGSFPATYAGDYGTHVFVPFQSASVLDPADVAAFDACLNSNEKSDNCTSHCCVNNCLNLPQGKTDSDGLYVSYNLPPVTPADPTVVAGYRACENCLGTVGGNCGPAGHATLPCDDPNITPFMTKSKVDAAIAYFAGSCSDFWSEPDHRYYDWGDNLPNGNVFYKALLQAMQLANQGSCQDAAFMQNIEKSFYEAWNQVAKFKKRLYVLEGDTETSPSPLRQKGIVQEAKDFRNIFEEGITEFKNFLTVTGQALIDARALFQDQEPLSKQAIYGWQDMEDGNQNGLWHLVRVDARVPGRCNDACRSDGSGPQRWPWIKAYLTHYGLRRCYKIADHTGIIKAKVTRFDQTKSMKGKNMKFPGGTPIWRFRRFHPDALFGSSEEEDIEKMVDSCKGFFSPRRNANPNEDWGNAFLIDKRDGEVQNGYRYSTTRGLYTYTWGNSRDCWDWANKLLRRGVTEEICAQYYLGHYRNAPHGYSQQMRFVPCPNFP